jgi:prepilin-type N-terminal cleavage/methylation domain-containing protein
MGMYGANQNLKRAFTLIEMLVVIGIIAILASLILPALSRGKRQSKVTVCLNNLHQISIAMELFVQDNAGRYPDPFHRIGGDKDAREFVCPSVTDQDLIDEMKSRPLYPYLKPSKVFSCPEDKGLDFSPDSLNYAPSAFYAWGMSYSYNSSTWKYTKHDPIGTLPGKTSAWVKQPSRYILMYEQPARPVWKQVGLDPCILYLVEYRYYFHWHFNTGKSTVTQDEFAGDGQKFISPILFVDGHATKYDFTQALRTDPQYPIEETKDWMWYQYVDPQPNNSLSP